MSYYESAGDKATMLPIDIRQWEEKAKAILASGPRGANHRFFL
jgi:hypothetical protein